MLTYICSSLPLSLSPFSFSSSSSSSSSFSLSHFFSFPGRTFLAVFYLSQPT